MRPFNPMVLWRWGFAIVLLGAGGWLVLSGHPIGRASGRTLGWMLIGYAVVRVLLGSLKPSPRDCRGVSGKQGNENPLDSGGMMKKS